MGKAGGLAWRGLMVSKMATPKAGYILPNGEKVSGTTTIIGRWKESGGLLQWAFKQGQSGVKSLYESRDKAADIGTAAHNMVERHINGALPDHAIEDTVKDLNLGDELASKAKNAFGTYLKWTEQSNVKIISKYQELQLVCPTLKYGGTPDALGKIGNDFVLLDWKTSNSVYPDYLMQLAAYKHLVENGIRMDTGQPLDLKITGGFYLCRFSKDFPDFGCHYYGELDLAWKQFRLLREAYDYDKQLKERVK